MSVTSTCPRFVRIILNLEKCMKEDLELMTPFIRIGMKGRERKEIIVAQPIGGRENLYIAVVMWPHDVSAGQLEVGLLGCGASVGVQLEGTQYSVHINHDTLIYIPWGGDMEDGSTGESVGQRVALFVNESPGKDIPIGVLGNIPELGDWHPDTCPDETVMALKKGLYLCSVPLDDSFHTPRDIAFQLVTCADGINLVWEGPSSGNKRAQLPTTGDVVIWSRWEKQGAKATPVKHTVDLSRYPGCRYAPQGCTVVKAQRSGVIRLPDRKSGTILVTNMDTNDALAVAETAFPADAFVQALSPRKRNRKQNKQVDCNCDTFNLLCSYYTCL